MKKATVLLTAVLFFAAGFWVNRFIDRTEVVGTSNGCAYIINKRTGEVVFITPRDARGRYNYKKPKSDEMVKIWWKDDPIVESQSKWSEITADPDYIALPDSEKVKLKDRYYHNVIEKDPSYARLSDAEKVALKKRFYERDIFDRITDQSESSE